MSCTARRPGERSSRFSTPTPRCWVTPCRCSPAPTPSPQTSLAERYPAGAAQPAWAAVLREGKYFVSADGQGRARVFLPGDDPRAAYRRAYSLLRHPLAAALAPGTPLQVEVFSYRNDFAAAELRLNPVPYRFRARSFPPQGQQLDLDELEAFFRQGGQLEGAELAPGGGLVLYASQAQQQSLGGQAVSLADLAVAYRAVFHAGDAEAFVSLDRNADPTLATVNFGGLLEDTRIGKAVLAADVRFKTICSGLDPVTYADIREKTRRAVPSFMSNSERHFLANPTADLGQWVTARYWYYPDSCGVETDEEDRFAAITRDAAHRGCRARERRHREGRRKNSCHPRRVPRKHPGSEQELRPLRRCLPRISRPLLGGPAHGACRLARPGAPGVARSRRAALGDAPAGEHATGGAPALQRADSAPLGR